jgi:hypothetical protein
MKRLLYIAPVATQLLFLLQFGDAYADGPYDGEWTGSATSTGRQCKPAMVTLTVQGKVVIGQAKFEVDAPNINGTVLADGTFGATIGFQRLTGKFVEDRIEGTFKSSDCEWNMILKRTK